MRTDLLTATEVAGHYGVTVKTVLRWCRTGKLEHIVTPGGHYRIPASAIG